MGFCQIKNLKMITPDYMGFDIISGADRKMFPGQIIQYILTPILKIPFRLVTEITRGRMSDGLLTNNALGPTLFGITSILLKKSPMG